MPRFGDIGKIARAATDAARSARDTSKERLSSVDADQLSTRIRGASEKTKNAVESAAERAIDVSKENLPSIDTDQLSQRVRDTSGKAVDAARSSTSVSQEFLDETMARVSDLTERAQGLPSEAIDKLFPECIAPMYIMPTGPGQDDYTLVFQFDEIIESLNSGVFVRPKIEAWSSGLQGRDLERLGEELKREFTNQFTQAREARVEFVKDMEEDAQEISDERKTEFKMSGAEIVSLSLTAAGLAASLPLVVSGIGGGLLAVILLLFALGYGAKALSLIEALLNQMSRSRSAKRELGREMKNESDALSELDSKSRTFQRAVQNIEIKTHPQIQELHRLICDVESVSFPSAEVRPTPDSPDIGPYLRHPEFLRQLPDHYQGLLTGICN